jgi:hypothetical protein
MGSREWENRNRIFSPFPIPHSPFPIPHSPFPIRGLLLLEQTAGLESG